MILFFVSLIAGFITILTPCTLPLLPVIVGSSVNGQQSKKKAIVITSSLGISVIVFTLLLKSSTLLINVSPEVWSFISGGVIVVFGVISVFPLLWEKLPFVSKLNVGSNKLLAVGYKKDSFWGDVLIGAALGPVFSTCSPTYFIILATVLPQSFFLGLIDLLAYAVGLSVVLLLVSLVGQKLIDKLGGISDAHGWFKRTLGIIFIIIGIAVIFGVDKKLEFTLLSNGLGDATKIEQTLLRLGEKHEPSSDEVDDETGATWTVSTSTSASSTQESKTKKVVSKGPKAAEITKPSGFINTNGQPVTIAQYKGKKVVLLDVWTYSCINCQRTIPYINAWYEKYKPYGLEIIGLHTPEFAFEKVQKNVEQAVRDFKINYPVVMDNDYATWNAFGNRYWPRKYLINLNGQIIYDHIGEGEYDVTEKAIQKALQELNDVNNTGLVVPTTISKPGEVVSVSTGLVSSPEIYFGASRNEYLANGQPHKTGTQNLTLPSTLQKNKLYLSGTWNFEDEYAQNTSAAAIAFNYEAKNVYMVASAEKDTTIKIFKDDKLEKTVTIKANTLYHLIEGNSYGTHVLKIEIPEGSIQVFTFTFG